MSNKSGPFSGRAGFTIIEIIMVTVILGVGALATARFLDSTGDRSRLRNEAYEILSALRCAQQLAQSRSSMASGLSYQVNFYNPQVFGLQENDPTRRPALNFDWRTNGQDPGMLILGLAQGLGTMRRLGAPSISERNRATGNMLWDTVTVTTDRYYLSNPALVRYAPTGTGLLPTTANLTTSDCVLYGGRARIPRLPFSSDTFGNITTYDRIVVHNLPPIALNNSLPASAPTQTDPVFIIRLTDWNGAAGTAITPWMESSYDVARKVP